MTSACIECCHIVSESVGKNGASVVGLSVSSANNSTVYGMLNLTANLNNGLDAVKNIVTSASQTSL